VKKGLPELEMARNRGISRNNGDNISRAKRLRRKSKRGFRIVRYIVGRRSWVRGQRSEVWFLAKLVKLM